MVTEIEGLACEVAGRGGNSGSREREAKGGGGEKPENQGSGGRQTPREEDLEPQGKEGAFREGGRDRLRGMERMRERARQNVRETDAEDVRAAHKPKDRD